jgi:excisionase family DNA binding protein
MNVGEVSAMLRVHPKTIYAWTAAGKLPSVCLNGRVRFERRAVNAFLESRAARFLDPATLTTNIALDLDTYDKLHLRGGGSAVNGKTRRWNYGFGSVYVRKTKDGKERWAIDYTDRGRRVREVVRDAQARGEALVALQARIAQAFDGRFAPLRRAEPTRFSRLAEIYLNDYAKTNKKSWRCDAYALDAHLKPYFGALRLEEITPHVVEQYRAERLRSVRRSSTNREMALLKTMFNRAIDWGLATENPVRKIKMFSERDNLKERILTEDEEARLLAKAAPHLRPFLVGLLNTGARRNELLTLRWENVDLERGTILLRHTKAGRDRLIPINGTLAATLAELKAESRGAYVFVGPKGRPVGTIRRAFENACRRAGLVGLRIHDLRHTFATRLVRRGVDIVTAQALLGHSNVTITQRYVHTGEDAKREAVRRLERESLARVRHLAEDSASPLPATQVLSGGSERPC